MQHLSLLAYIPSCEIRRSECNLFRRKKLALNRKWKSVITAEASLGLRSKCHNNALYYVLTWSYVNLNPFI